MLSGLFGLQIILMDIGNVLMKNKHKQMYMDMAKVLASASKDERLKVGTVIIGVEGAGI